MKLTFTFLVLCTFVRAQYWVQLPDFPGSKRDDGVAVVVNNKAYFGTGLQEGFSATNDFYALDLNTRSWEKIPNMPNNTERQYACAFAGNNCFYVFGGDAFGAQNDLFKYDVASASWTSAAPKPGTGLIGASCFVFGDKVIITGGKTQTAGVLNDQVWEYSMSANTWAQKNNFPFTPRWRSSAAVLNNKGYIVFGQEPNDTCSKAMYRYDHASDSWTKLADFPTPHGRSYAAMQSLKNRLVLFGGVDCYANHFNDLWYYSDVSNSWSRDISLPSFTRRGGMSCAAGDYFYYSCGIDAGFNRLKETWMTDIPLGLETPRLKDQVRVYPNPFKDELSVTTIGLTEATLTIYDGLGKMVYTTTIEAGNNATVNTDNLAPGIYVMTISDGQRMTSNKIMKD